MFSRSTISLFALALMAFSVPAYSADDEDDSKRRRIQLRQVEEGAQQSAEFRAQAQAKRLEAIQRLKDLLSRGAEGDTKAEMMLRLADLYFAQGRDIYFSEMEAFDAAYERCFNTDGCIPENLQPDNRQSKEWQERSIKLYENILRSYPRYARADQATFFLGSALTDIGDQKEGVSAFKKLVKLYPESAYVPDAYILIGEYYFENNEAFPALKAYLKASSYTNHPKYGFAKYKLAWCYYNVGEYDQAIGNMKEVVQYSMAADQSQKSNIQLQDEALKDLVRFFADAGQMNEAYDYFNSLGKKDLIRKTLRRLASTYYENGQFEQSVETYRRLILEEPSSTENPGYQGEIIKAYKQIGDKEKTLEEVDRLLREYGKDSSWARANASDPNAIADAQKSIEKNLRTLAVDYHNQAKTLEKSRHPSATGVYELARQAYNTYLQQFPQGEHTYDVRYAYGELLYKLKDYAGAFDQYMLVVQTDPKGKHSKFCAESAIFAAEEQVKLEGGGKLPQADPSAGKRDPIPLTAWEQRLVDACKQFATLYPQDTKVIGVIFKSAYLLYNKYQFTAAAEQFNVVINMNPSSSQAEQAANLILDTFVLEKNWSELKKNAKFYYEMKNLGSSKFKQDVYNIYENASFKLIEADYEKDQDHGKAADAFMAYYGEFPDAKNAALALNNSSIYYYKANRVADAMKVRHILIDDPKFGVKTKYYYDQIAALGFDYQQIADYDKSAFYYEKLFNLFPAEVKKREGEPERKESIPEVTTKASDALYSAAVFRTAMGDWQRGIENYNTWMAAFPADTQIPEVQLTVGKIYEDNAQWDKAADVFYKFYTKPPEGATKDFIYFARSHYANALRKQGKEKNAIQVYTETVKLWDKEGRPAEGTELVAEMMFVLAQPKLDKYLTLRLEGKTGAPPKQQDKALLASLKAKTQALQDVQTTFTEIVQTGAGEWGLASLVALGKAYENMGQSFRTGDIPDYLTEDQREIYTMQVEDKSYVQDEKAIEAYKLALEKSYEFTLYNENTGYATRRLGELRPNEYQGLQETLMEPRYTSKTVGSEFNYEQEMK
ncbi:MAG: tetratricopeptide repeat protein [Alphaproteobacteria bacterium]|nr:tetratricopeptide repeat protein [Alphaproteobacteria bacterium]